MRVFKNQDVVNLRNYVSLFSLWKSLKWFDVFPLLYKLKKKLYGRISMDFYKRAVLQ